MIPVTAPCDTTSLPYIYKIASTVGLTEWVDYIPVQTGTAAATQRNRTNATGYQAVNSLASNSGLTAFKDYIPVSIVTGRTKPWSTDADGYIPLVAETGSLSGTPSLSDFGTSAVYTAPGHYLVGGTWSNNGTKFHAVRDPGSAGYWYGCVETFSGGIVTSNITQSASIAATGTFRIRDAKIYDSGTRILIADLNVGYLKSAPLTVANDLSSGIGALTNHASLAATTPRTVDISSDGYWVYINDNTAYLGYRPIRQYKLTTPWDMSSVVVSSYIFNPALGLFGLCMTQDGSKAFTVDGPGIIQQWDLSTPYDLATATINVSETINTRLLQVGAETCQSIRLSDEDSCLIANCYSTSAAKLYAYTL